MKLGPVAIVIIDLTEIVKNKKYRQNIYVHLKAAGKAYSVWRRCDTGCTSGFLDIVKSANNSQEYVMRKVYSKRFNRRHMLKLTHQEATLIEGGV